MFDAIADKNVTAIEHMISARDFAMNERQGKSRSSTALTPLVAAIQTKDKRVVQTVLKPGSANLLLKVQGKTPLEWAHECGGAEVKALLRAALAGRAIDAPTSTGSVEAARAAAAAAFVAAAAALPHLQVVSGSGHHHVTIVRLSRVHQEQWMPSSEHPVFRTSSPMLEARTRLQRGQTRLQRSRTFFRRGRAELQRGRIPFQGGRARP